MYQYRINSFFIIRYKLNDNLLLFLFNFDIHEMLLFLYSNPVFILFTLSLPRDPLLGQYTLPSHHFSLYSAPFPFIHPILSLLQTPFFTPIQSFSFLPLSSTTIPFRVRVRVRVVPPSLTSLQYLSSPPHYSLILVSYSFDVYVVAVELFIQLDNHII